MTGAQRQGWGVVVHHPSRRSEVARTYARLAERLAAERPGYVLWCLDTPTGDVLAHVATAPAGQALHVVPLLLAPGKHFAEDVRALADALAGARPDLTVRIKPPLLEDESFMSFWFASL